MKRRDKHQWMLDRVNDYFFKKAKEEGYRARSAYKLIEIQEKNKLIPKVGNILDLGCAPGAWVQVLKKYTKGNIYGVDLLNINSIPNIKFFKGDAFSSEFDIFLGDVQFDLILSDIAPNCSGIKKQDHLRIMNLADSALDLISKRLKVGGSFCIKIFDGSEVIEYVKKVKLLFKSVKFNKPKASHNESNEFYLICKDKLS